MEMNIDEARKFLENRQWDEGIIYLEKLLSKRPHDPDLVDLQVKFYISKYKGSIPSLSVPASVPEISEELIPVQESVPAATPEEKIPPVLLPEAASAVSEEPVNQGSILQNLRSEIAHCPSCGVEMNPGSYICDRCGAVLETEDTSSEKEPSSVFQELIKIVYIPEIELKNPLVISALVSAFAGVFIYPEIFAALAFLLGGLAYVEGWKKAGSISFYLGLMLWLLRIMKIRTLSIWLVN